MLDWFFGLLTPTQWDAWRNWLVAIGGFIALTVALNTYRRNVKTKREEQARLVYSTLTHVTSHHLGDDFPLLPHGATTGIGMIGVRILIDSFDEDGQNGKGRAMAPLTQATVTVHNGSKELIGPAKVQIVDGESGQVFDQFSIVLAAVEPESDEVVTFIWVQESLSIPRLATTVIFRDSTAQWWRRHRAEPIERVHDDPANTEDHNTVEGAFFVHAKSPGMPPTLRARERKLTWRVRWHRFWRKRAGKPATP